MRVSELIDILREQPGDADVELAVIQPVNEEADDITVDRYLVEAVWPWVDHDDSAGDGSAEGEGEDGGELVIWLIGGEDDDVDSFLDAVEQQTE